MTSDTRSPNATVAMPAARSAAPILADPKPTIAFDAAATKAAEEEAAEQAPPVQVVHPRGEALYAPGDVLTAEQVTRAHAGLRLRAAVAHVL
ncbi:MAG: hypothetical protein ACKOFI_01025, partial [Phycisphaerales bacterium]